MVESKPIKECAICLTDQPFIKLSCCHAGHEQSSIQVCHQCMTTICNANGNGIGNCPRCRKSLAIENGVAVERIHLGHCIMCKHYNIPLQTANLCPKCFDGKQNPLNYRCQRCQRVQKIPHPMYKYQITSDTQGSSSWACHQGCGDYTMWIIVKEDIAKIPKGSIPSTWAEGKNAGLDEAREIVKKARKNSDEAREIVKKARKNSCIIF